MSSDGLKSLSLSEGALKFVFEFRMDIESIAADQAKEYDDLLAIPIHSRKHFIHAVRRYLQYNQTLAPSDPDALSQDFFVEQLRWLSDKGEDIERLLLWFGSLADHIGPQNLNRGAKIDWESTLLHWSWGDHPLPDPSAVPNFGWLIDQYRSEVLEKEEQLSERSKVSEARFKAGPEHRTEWDNFLWDAFFGEASVEPTTFIKPAMDNVWHRRWWRQCGPQLSQSEKDALYEAHVASTQIHGDLEVMDWSYIIPLDDALDVDNVPDFDRYKRDW